MNLKETVAKRKNKEIQIQNLVLIHYRHQRRDKTYYQR